MDSARIAILNSTSFGIQFPHHLARLQSLGCVERLSIPSRASPAEMVALLSDFDAIVAGVTPSYTAEFFHASPKLTIIARHGIGYDNVDVEAATAAGIVVTVVPGAIEQTSVAEHTLGLLLTLLRNCVPAAQAVREGRWGDRARFIGTELRGKSVGILGLGNIGSKVAEILSLGFKATVLASDPALSEQQIMQRHAHARTLEDLLAQSDILVIACPLDSSTRKLISADRLKTARHGLYIVNVARAGIVDHSALHEGLLSGAIGGYAADVLEDCTSAVPHPIVSLPNVVIVPQLGGYTDTSLEGMGEAVVTAIESALDNRSIPGAAINGDLANPRILRKH